MCKVRLGAFLVAGACVASCTLDFDRYEPTPQDTGSPDASTGADAGAGNQGGAGGSAGSAGRGGGGGTGSATAGNGGGGANAGAAGFSGTGAAGAQGGSGGDTDGGQDGPDDVVADNETPDVQDTGAPDVPIACTDPGARTWPQNGHCYFPAQGPSRSWSAQSNTCVAAGAHLVTITSDAEQNFVQSIGAGASRWIGFSVSGGGPWSWVTGEPQGYEHWEAGAPSAAPDACARMNRTNNTWADRPCNNAYSAICERE
jgi:hypothetical protein